MFPPELSHHWVPSLACSDSTVLNTWRAFYTDPYFSVIQHSSLHNSVLWPQATLVSLANSVCSAQGSGKLCWVSIPSCYSIEPLSRLSAGTIVRFTLLVYCLSGLTVHCYLMSSVLKTIVSSIFTFIFLN